jgi:hypothetical protein
VIRSVKKVDFRRGSNEDKSLPREAPVRMIVFETMIEPKSPNTTDTTKCLNPSTRLCLFRWLNLRAYDARNEEMINGGEMK